MNSTGLFKSIELFESGNMMQVQVQVSVLTVTGKVKTMGQQSGMDMESSI